MRYQDGERSGRRRRFDDDDLISARRSPRPEPRQTSDDGDKVEHDAPETGDRWSTWDQSTAGERGPQPYPAWLVTELAAVDVELGIVKSGKEADVSLIRRQVPDTPRTCLLAAKRYRPANHRMFHRDSGYLEGRRVRESRVNRATARRSGFGREMIAAQWAASEFAALCQLWQVGREMGVRIVPYPVQVLGTELLLEFLGSEEGTSAPRLAQLRPGRGELTMLWEQALDAMTVLARCGLAHGDLSPYNVLVDDNGLVLIDFPQVVDVIANPHGLDYLARDVRNMVTWFMARGLIELDEDMVLRSLASDAGLTRAW